MKVQSLVRNLEYNNNVEQKFFHMAEMEFVFQNTHEQIEKNIFKYS